MPNSQPVHIHFDALPTRAAIYTGVLKGLFAKRQTTHPQLPQLLFSIAKLTPDLDNLNAYRRICGFANDGRMPATYFAVLAQALQMTLMADSQFPFAMLGLVHIYNKVLQRRAIFDSESVQLSVKPENLQPHSKGWQFDFASEVRVGDKLVWQGISTYLARQKPSHSPAPAAKQPPAIRLAVTPTGLQQTLKIAENIGRRYALVSGDFNAIHLHPLTAKIFGFPRAIAHGMWSQAKVLSLFPTLPSSFACEVWFKAPIFLPSQVEFIASQSTAAGDWQFGVYGKGDKVHLLGNIHALAP